MDHESELAFLLSMGEEERMVYLMEEAVEEAITWYDKVIQFWQQDRAWGNERKQQAGRVRYWKGRLNAARATLEKKERDNKPSPSLEI